MKYYVLFFFVTKCHPSIFVCTSYVKTLKKADIYVQLRLYLQFLTCGAYVFKVGIILSFWPKYFLKDFFSKEQSTKMYQKWKMKYGWNIINSLVDREIEELGHRGSWHVERGFKWFNNRNVGIYVL